MSRKSGQADFPHPALGQGDSHVRSRATGCHALELEQPQGLVQIAVREP